MGVGALCVEVGTISVCFDCVCLTVRALFHLW